MSLFLTPAERAHLLTLPAASPAFALLSALQTRVEQRASSPAFTDRSATTDWWHHAAEYLTDAALIHSVRPSPTVSVWLHAAITSIARRPLADWAGPPFRGGFDGTLTVGCLETSHLAWGLAIAYDLAGDLFTDAEHTELRSVLRERGLVPCRGFIDQTGFCHNWNCVLLAGFAVTAAVLDDREALDHAASWFPLGADHFQPDGSYGESLQYANYAAYSLMLAREAILRRDPAAPLTLDPYIGLVDWSAQALFYKKPLSGWGPTARARSANFGDSAALFRPSGDLLIHFAAHGRTSHPKQAAVARWLFDTLYFPADEPGPHDMASFGFVCGFGFLSVILLHAAAEPLAPGSAGHALTTAFSGGDAFTRDAWDGLTTLAVRTAAAPRHATAHLHGDINSFILVHRSERLLLDPGHSCYRNLNHDLEAASLTHNTCTFELPATSATPARQLTQRGNINRAIVREAGLPPRGGAPIHLGGQRLLSARLGPVSVLGSEAAALYGAPLRRFTRLWILCGSHALFIVDHIDSAEPVRTTWHWLLNNRDGVLDLQFQRPRQFTARRGDAGLRLRHFGGGSINGPVYAHVHDAYHPLPAQLGEGKTGSGLLLRFSEPAPAATRTVVHALALDTSAITPAWEATRTADTYTLAAPDARERWSIHITDTTGTAFRIVNDLTNEIFTLIRDASAVWSLR